VSARLRPLRADEFASFYERAQAGYAASIEHAGGWTHEAAVAKAERDMTELWPDGLATADQWVYVVEDESGEEVGDLWVAEREVSGRQALFVYDVEIGEKHRGHGFGRAAMLLAEDEARARGLSFVALNVFGGNEVARNLYRALGYEEMAVAMGKELA
jgi:ribosomal protein S18 acetylase RimI-like enzyme